MRLVQHVFIFSIILAVDIMRVECQLKFDADGNIIDDGLNLNIPSLPNNQKKSKPVVAKAPRPAGAPPIAERVMGNVASKGNAKGGASKDTTSELDKLLKMAGLDSKGQKLESPKVNAEKVSQGQQEQNPLANLDPEQLKALLANAGKSNPDSGSKAKEEVSAGTNLGEAKPPVAEGAKETKPAQALEPIQGQAGGEPAKETQDSVIQLPTVGVSKKGVESLNNPTEATAAGLRKLNVKEANDGAVEESRYQEGDQIELYPWQSEICQDYDEEACSSFKPMCSLMGVIAHKMCRKTCKLCLQDKPSPRTLKSKLKEFSLTLTQNGPFAPAFLTVCVDNSAAQRYGLPDDVLSLIIHAYGDATEDTCENFGPHFNPYGVQHGHPEDVTKHVGDLGILEFRKVPDEWPEDVIRCKENQIGSYGVFDHINLYGENSPCFRPVVLYKGEAPTKEFKSSLAIACDVLKADVNTAKSMNKQSGQSPDGATQAKQAEALLSAHRVKQTEKNEDKTNKTKVKDDAATRGTEAPGVTLLEGSRSVKANGTEGEEEKEKEKETGVTEKSADLQENKTLGELKAEVATDATNAVARAVSSKPEKQDAKEKTEGDEDF